MNHQQQLEGMFAGMGTKELRAMLVVTATEYAARLRDQSPIREHVDAGASVELLVTLEPPGVHCLLVDSDGKRHILAVGSLRGEGH